MKNAQAIELAKQLKNQGFEAEASLLVKKLIDEAFASNAADEGGIEVERETEPARKVVISPPLPDTFKPTPLVFAGFSAVKRSKMPYTNVFEWDRVFETILPEFPESFTAIEIQSLVEHHIKLNTNNVNFKFTEADKGSLAYKETSSSALIDNRVRGPVWRYVFRKTLDKAIAKGFLTKLSQSKFRNNLMIAMQPLLCSEAA